MRYYKYLFLFYRSLGTNKFQSLLSTFLKPFLHYILYRRPSCSIYYLTFFKKKFNYSNGFWLSMHFGVQHLRPVLVNQNCIYLRGDKNAKIAKNTDTSNLPVQIIYVEKFQNKFLKLINFLKDKNIILATIDGKFGNSNESILIDKYKLKFNKNLIDLAVLLNKKCFFEIFYMNNLFQIKRAFVSINSSNYKKNIKDLLLSIIKKYPHNAREDRFLNDN